MSLSGSPNPKPCTVKAVKPPRGPCDARADQLLGRLAACLLQPPTVAQPCTSGIEDRWII